MLYSEPGFARLVFHLTEDLYSILDFTGWTSPLSFLPRDSHNTFSKKNKAPDEHSGGRSACKLDRETITSFISFSTELTRCQVLPDSLCLEDSLEAMQCYTGTGFR